MKLSLSQAAKKTGVSKPTLSRWIKKGEISAEKLENGGYQIDASELDRVISLKERGNNVTRNGNYHPGKKFFYDQEEKEGRRELATRIDTGTHQEPIRSPQLELTDRTNALLSDILTTCGDPHSEGSYRKLIATHSEELIRTALSETRQAKLEGRIIKSRGAYFTDTLKRLAELRRQHAKT